MDLKDWAKFNAAVYGFSVLGYFITDGEDATILTMASLVWAASTLYIDYKLIKSK